MTHDQEKRAAEHAARIKSAWQWRHTHGYRVPDGRTDFERRTERAHKAITKELAALHVLVEDLTAKIGAK